MWSIEKFGAISGRRQVAALRPRIFLNPTGRGKLNRQTPLYRNHSKSQKTNNRDLLKSPKNQILQHHTLRACGLISTVKNQQSLPFLTGSALQTEIAVTHSKQSLGSFLTGSRIAPLSSTDRALSAQARSLFCPTAARFAIMSPAQTSPARRAT